VREDVLRPLAARVLYIAERTPRYSNISLAWFALKRLLGWTAPTGRYSRVAIELLEEWRRDDHGAWWNGAAGKGVQRLLYNRAKDVKALKGVPVLQGVLLIEERERSA